MNSESTCAKDPTKPGGSGRRPSVVRSHPPWSAKDLSALFQAAAQGANADQTARKLRRSWIDVVRKAKAEGIALNPSYRSSFVYGETDEAYWNTGTPWSKDEIRDLRYAAKQGDTLEEVSISSCARPSRCSRRRPSSG